MLGETSDPQELFFIDECEDSPLSAASGKANVTRLLPLPNWAALGGSPLQELAINIGPDDGKTFYYQKRYIVRSYIFGCLKYNFLTLLCHIDK